MAEKIIQENNAFKKGGGQNEKFKFCARKKFRESDIERNKIRKEKKRERVIKQGKLSWRLNRIARKEKECCQCGAKGHFRFEYPVSVAEQKRN